MQAQSNFGACGRFQMTATRPDGTTRVAAEWQPNLLTDAGLKSFATEQYSDGFSSAYARMLVGTGSGTPSVTDVALFNQVASLERIRSYNNQGAFTKSHTTVSPYYKSTTLTWVFDKGAAAGNLTELGIESKYDVLLSHALIKDSAGTATSITVAADEVLTVVYELRFYLLDTTDQTGTVTLEGVSTSFTSRPSHIDRGDYGFVGLLSEAFNYLTFYDSSAALGPITGEPSGSDIGGYISPSTLTAVSLSAGVASQSGTFTVPAEEMNSLATNVAAMTLSNSLSSKSFLDTQISFNPPFAKDNTKEFTFTVEATWQRYTP